MEQQLLIKTEEPEKIVAAQSAAPYPPKPETKQFSLPRNETQTIIIERSEDYSEWSVACGACGMIIYHCSGGGYTGKTGQEKVANLIKELKEEAKQEGFAKVKVEEQMLETNPYWKAWHELMDKEKIFKEDFEKIKTEVLYRLGLSNIVYGKIETPNLAFSNYKTPELIEQFLEKQKIVKDIEKKVDELRTKYWNFEKKADNTNELAEELN
jgi:hypothetical protein